MARIESPAAPPGDLLLLGESEPPGWLATLERGDPALGFEHPVNGAEGLLQSPGDVADGLPGLPSLPQLLLACRRQPSGTTQPHHLRTSGPDNTENLACCTDRLHPPLVSVSLPKPTYPGVVLTGGAIML
jgi:hypothetical protein